MIPHSMKHTYTNVQRDMHAWDTEGQLRRMVNNKHITYKHRCTYTCNRLRRTDSPAFLCAIKAKLQKFITAIQPPNYNISYT